MGSRVFKCGVSYTESTHTVKATRMTLGFLRKFVKQVGHALKRGVSRVYGGEHRWQVCDAESVMYVYGRKVDPNLYQFKENTDEREKTKTT